MNNEVWNNGNGGYFGYTEDADLIRRINRHKKWKVAAEYHKAGKRLAVQYTIPLKERRAALYMFDVAGVAD